MCARRLLRMAPVALCAMVMAGCAAPQRTGTNFCRQLATELPAIAQPVSTTREISQMVDRYERLLRVAPLSVERDLAVLTDVLKQAANVDTTDPEQVQALADASYAANQSALSVRDWVKSTCAVDISTGMNIDPPRVATTTLAPTTTVDSTTAPSTAAPSTTVPATAAP